VFALGLGDNDVVEDKAMRNRNLLQGLQLNLKEVQLTVHQDRQTLGNGITKGRILDWNEFELFLCEIGVE
jgi:hypothetical protein